jgi:CDP-diacylglycerol--glycerol-3-phosphate 3-phosphatidyltransferase
MSALVMLVHLGRVGAWVVILLLARDLAVTGLRTIAMSEGVVIAAGQEGKYKTAIQLAGIVFLLIHYPYPVDFFFFTLDIDSNRAGTGLLYLSLVFSLWSAGKYFLAFVEGHYRRGGAGGDPAV